MPRSSLTRSGGTCPREALINSQNTKSTWIQCGFNVTSKDPKLDGIVLIVSSRIVTLPPSGFSSRDLRWPDPWIQEFMRREVSRAASVNPARESQNSGIISIGVMAKKGIDQQKL